MPQGVSPPRAAAGTATGIAGVLAMIAAATISVEGGYVNNPNDPGGETNNGVTKTVAVANGYTGPMKALTKDRATQILVDQYIVKPGFQPIVERDVSVGKEMIDTGFNVGPSREAVWFQQSLNHLNNRGVDYPDVATDGKIGPGTLKAYDAYRKKRGKQGCVVLVRMLDAKQAGHYMSLFGDNSKFETFAFGWFNTRIGNVDLSKCGS